MAVPLKLIRLQWSCQAVVSSPHPPSAPTSRVSLSGCDCRLLPTHALPLTLAGSRAERQKGFGSEILGAFKDKSVKFNSPNSQLTTGGYGVHVGGCGIMAPVYCVRRSSAAFFNLASAFTSYCSYKLPHTAGFLQARRLLRVTTFLPDTHDRMTCNNLWQS